MLVPTRELAQQVAEVAQIFASSSNVRHVCVYGGSPKMPQIRELERGQFDHHLGPGSPLQGEFPKEGIFRGSGVIETTLADLKSMNIEYSTGFHLRHMSICLEKN